MSSAMEWVWRQPLKMRRKMVLGALLDQSGHSGEEFSFELALVSHLTSLSERYVVDSLKVLAEMGLITLIGGDADKGRPARIKLHLDVTVTTVDGRKPS